MELSPPILHEAGLGPALEWLGRWMREKHGLEVELRVSDATPDREDVRVLLFEAVRELLFNVVKHAGVTRATVEMGLHDEDTIRVSVSDEGVGFDADGTWSAISMSGRFGLMSLRERLGLLGGRMDVRSEPNEGAAFTLYAPIRSAIASDSAAGQSTAYRAETIEVPPAAVSCSLERHIRVLLADDHAVMRQGLRSLLSEEPDIKVIGEACTGVEAVELARRMLPDVVLMDLSMPEMNGIEAARILHKEFPDMRIIGLSMFDEADRAAALLEAGASAYITKSGRTDELVKAIRGAGVYVGQAGSDNAAPPPALIDAPMTHVHVNGMREIQPRMPSQRVRTDSARPSV